MPLRSNILSSIFILCLWTGLLPRISGAQIDAEIVKELQGDLDYDPCRYWSRAQAISECLRAERTFKRIPEHLRGPCKNVIDSTCNNGSLRCHLLIQIGPGTVTFRRLKWCIKQAGILKEPTCMWPLLCKNASVKKRTKKMYSKRHMNRNSSNMFGSGGNSGAGGHNPPTRREDTRPEGRAQEEERHRGQYEERSNSFGETIEDSENEGEERNRTPYENWNNSFRKRLQDRGNLGEETNRGQLESRNSSFGEGIQERVKSLLECAYCSEVQRPPYKRCQNQHLICNNCSHWWPRGECPLCRKPVTRQQDDALLTEMVRLILQPTDSAPGPPQSNGGTSPQLSNGQSDDNVVALQRTNPQQQNSVPEETQPGTPESRLVPIGGSQPTTPEQSRP